jgi:ABC-type antimicrobial peptide transport system permease subunit
VYGVGTRDTASLAIAGAVAVVTGLVGSYLPVRRAGSASVIAALRGE